MVVLLSQSLTAGGGGRRRCCFWSLSSYNKNRISKWLNVVGQSSSTNKTSKQLLVQSHHALVVTTGNTNNIFIASKLISLYASLHLPHLSSKVFYACLLQQKADSFLWNSLIQSQFSTSNYLSALDFYVKMRSSNTHLTRFTIPLVAASCAELSCLHQGQCLHAHVLKSGLFPADHGNSAAAVGASFVYMYSKCGVMADAALVFAETTERDLVSWTSLIIGYVHNGDNVKALLCLSDMHRDGVRMSFRTVEGGLQACANLSGSGGSLERGRCLHALLVKLGLACGDLVQSSLLSMYCKCGENIEDAHRSFYQMEYKDLFSWTSIIGACARFGLVMDFLILFRDMQASGVHPDGIVVSCILLGLGSSMSVGEGKAFHCLIMRKNYELDPTVKNALLSMYCKFGLLTYSEKLFDRLISGDKEPWNAMVMCYGKLGMKSECLDVFREMQHLGIEADSPCLVSVISLCSHLDCGAQYACRSLHAHVIKRCKREHVSVANSLIDTYGKSGNLTLAQRIFSTMERDVVTWNTLISSYARNGFFAQAISLFDEMLTENLKPNSGTLVMVLSACANLAYLEKGEKVHLYIEAGALELNLSLATALIDMYAKCGQLEKARTLFDAMNEKDVVTWNVIISGYGMHGDAREAIEIFQEMEKSEDVKPNALTFLSLLSACAHSGLVEQGKHLFCIMQEVYAVEPNLKHYTCMVDLLAKSGNLQKAEEMVLSMRILPDGGVWGALLTACKTHNDFWRGIRIAKRAIESDPENEGYYVMLSNLYASIGKWQEAEEAREVIKEKGIIGDRVGWSTV